MKIDISDKAQKQLDKLDKPIKKRILKYMRDVGKLANPRSRGKALTSNLAGLWRYRVGDYRVVCRIIDSELLIITVDVGHRREVYNP